VVKAQRVEMTGNFAGIMKVSGEDILAVMWNDTGIVSQEPSNTVKMFSSGVCSSHPGTPTLFGVLGGVGQRRFVMVSE